MVWILRRRTRTLAKWVMSPDNLKMFMFAIGSDLKRVGQAALRTPSSYWCVCVCGCCKRASTQDFLPSQHVRFGVAHSYSHSSLLSFSLFFFWLIVFFPLISTNHDVILIPKNLLFLCYKK